MSEVSARIADYERIADTFRQDVLRGLSKNRKSIPSQYLYDRRGSALFDEICRQPEYYPTRTEIGILRRRVGEIAELIGPGCQLIEFGSGSSVKTRLLLDALQDPAMYVPIDVSAAHLHAACAELAEEYPDLSIRPLIHDFASIPPTRIPSTAGPRLGFFPGSTIGNMQPEEAQQFLADAAQILQPGGALVLGADLPKSTRLLEEAYNDAAGITAAFSLNLLRRINRELGGTFDLGQFRHDARYNVKEQRVEIHLVSSTDQLVRVAGKEFKFRAGEQILTEYSYKYSVDRIYELSIGAGFEPDRTWIDDDGLFAVHYLRTA